MGENKYAQEFLCRFQFSKIEGSYYGSLINDLEAKSRITTIDRDDLCRSFVAWDLGISDSTSLWVAQLAGKEVRLIDYHEAHGVGLDYYVRWLRENKYEDFEQFLPHDVEVRELGTGKSRKEVLQEAGPDIRVAPRLSIADGIQAARRLIPRCWFDHKTKTGLDALRNYRREFNERQNVYYDKPLHNWASHAADSFRYLAITLDEGITVAALKLTEEEPGMSEDKATVRWTCTGPDFLKGRYSREHTWTFDGGLTVPASPSPHVVPKPWSNPAYVDPEEAFVAAVSSCHMLTFLFLASRAGYQVDSYHDEAVGLMTKNEKGVLWVSSVMRKPKIVFSEAKHLSPADSERLHHQAHEQCFIANSVRTQVVVASCG